ncbi:MAG: heme lyase CcmF/NrfE family subunit [Nitrospinota bacterium]|nr:heme lyase CcmF/NrfE family subunit [Nitrospinota bacterium]
MVELGEIALVLSLVTSVYVTAVSWYGGKTDNQVMIKSAQNGIMAMFVLLSVAAWALMRAILTHDYSLKYVYNYTSTDLHPFYLFSAFWAGQKGSLLLWAWMLAGFGAIVIFQNRIHNRKLLPYVVSIISATLVLFNMLMVYASPVFEKLQGIPADGYGLNPMLQNPGMVFHPPTLYIGFVAFTVPYAFAMAALISNQLGDVWIRSTRRWTVFAWFFLGLGNLFGANWAYVELGWGGYWAWDPVENASFMPWLVGTAFLHSVMIQEKRDMLKVWNVSLIAVTFALTIFGTFITRSGLISSVHSFGETTVGYYFLAFLFIIIAFSVYLISSKLELLRSENQLDSMVSRESSFLFNNLMLLGSGFAVFWGTIFPMISEAVTGTKITVGPPFFNKVMVPIGFALLVLTGLCPLIPWRQATLARLQKNFLIPTIVSIVAGGLLIALGQRNITAWLFFTASFFVLSTIVLEFARGISARGAMTGEKNILKLVYNLIARNKRRYGGYIIHAGMVCLFFGFAGSEYNEVKEFTVKEGESYTISDYTLTYYGYTHTKPKPTKDEVAATMLIEKNGKKLGFMRPEKNFYKNQNQPNSEVAILSSLKEDLYLILGAINSDESASFKVHVNPLVVWLWIGGWIMCFGTILVMWPDARETKRFKARYSES